MTRFRRPVIIAVIACVGLVGAAALAIGFHPPTQSSKAAETETAVETAAAGPDLRGLASSYGLNATSGGDATLLEQTAATAARPATPEQQQALAMAQSALSAGPFFGAVVPSTSRSSGLQAPEGVDPQFGANPWATVTAKPSDGGTSPLKTLQDLKHDFIANGSDPVDYVAAPYRAPASPYEVKAGDIISAALLTAINSDLPGEIVAQVTRNVFDHSTGRRLLIPQGARLLGHYDSQVAYGQSRVLIVWNRIIMPDGRSINIGSMTGGDGQGASGLADRVDAHIGPLARAIALSTAITAGGLVAQDAATRSQSGLVLTDSAGGVSAQASQAGQRFIERDLGRQPTITVRAGWPVVVIASRDIVLEPY